MEFKIECPWCNQHYSVDDSFIGQNVECSVCGKEFVVRRPPVSTPLSSSTSPESKASDATSFFRTATAVASRNNTVDWMTKQNYKPTVPWTRLTPAVDHKPEKKTFLPKSKMRRVFVAIAFLFLIVLCVVYVKVIPEKEYKNGLRAYNEQRTEDAIVHYHSESANLYYSKALECYQNASKTGDVSGKIRTKMFSCKMALDLDVK